MNDFKPKDFEEKITQKWLQENIYKTPEIDETKEKYYSLYSFPYPSGSGLHVGHAEGMVANDIVARYWRMKDRNVIFPMGWDSFGLPAENYAIKTGTPPKQSTEEAVKTFYEQINRLGISVDWETEVGAHRPNYYQWTQWIFLQLYKKGLAYKKLASVNWCPKDQTVLANEQVIDGKCERCDSQVIQKDMEQWFFKITDYADRLHFDLEKVDWPQGTKLQQRNWIGRSEGTTLSFKMIGSTKESSVQVFTTRLDTIFGATFIVLAPENAVINEVKDDIKNWADVERYINASKDKTDLEKQTQKEKNGIKLEGIKAINPFSNEEIPVYIADYVLNGYGTGAIMAVPAHDERDGEFAKKYGIEIKKVIDGGEGSEEIYTGFGSLVNSDEYNGMSSENAVKKMQEWLKENNLGEAKVTYRLRDWLVSRQRYWGCPIPIVYDPEGNPHAIDEKDLPLLLPEDVEFKPTGESPIKGSESFKKLAEERYGEGWYFEADTMDTFVDSSWYFLRHTDAKNKDTAFDSSKVNYWLPADLYMIGPEHTVLHLLYSRFFTKFLFDEGFVKFDEPFYFMRHMGTILGSDGRKMSKRWGNVINPTDEVEKYGADTVRMYEMFMGPLEESKPWNDKALSGVSRFLKKVWDLQNFITDDQTTALEVPINKLIKKIESDTVSLSFNTAVSEFMKFVNHVYIEKKISKEIYKNFLLVLSPYAPFITEELWQRIGNSTSIHLEKWPKFNPDLLNELEVKIGVQINGKMRGTIDISKDASEEEAMEKAKGVESINKYLTSDPKKVIYVKGRILNIII